MRPYLEVSAEQRRAVREAIVQVVSHRPEVRVAFLFGSFATDPRFHDIDLGVIVDPELVSKEAAFDFVSDLATDLEWKVRLPIDLNVLNYATIALRYNASRGELLYCTDDDVRTEFLERTWREYFDFEPFLRSSLKDLLRDRLMRPSPGQ